MDPTVPRGAAILLDFLAQHESGGSYTVIYGNHQGELPHPITTMTVDALLAAQKVWGKRWGSSAAGRYQIMGNTLAGLKKTLLLGGTTPFSADLQDRLGYQLLKQRGYASFKLRGMSVNAFAKALAQEWASLPVLVPAQGAHGPVARGESYYANDGLNKALISPGAFEAALAKSLAA